MGSRGEAVAKTAGLTARTMLTYFGGYYAVVVLKDLLKGKQITDLSNPQNIEKVMASSGWGGYWAMLLSNVKGIYGSDDYGVFTGLPASNLMGSAKRSIRLYGKNSTLNQREQNFNRAKAIGSLSGVSNLWFMRGIYNYSLEQALLSPADKRRMDRRYENYNKGVKRR